MENANNHIAFVKKMIENNDLLHEVTECMRTSTIYWTLNTFRMLGVQHNKEFISDAKAFVESCHCDNGGFSPKPEYSPTLYATLGALQVLYLTKSDAFKMGIFNAKKTIRWILSLQTTSGGFKNDIYGDVDTRIDACAVLSIRLVELLKAGNFDRDALDLPIQWSEYDVVPGFSSERLLCHILNCYNVDGGFGQIEGAESHAAQVFTCLTTLKMLDKMDAVDLKEIGMFLAKRQTLEGGLAGRLNKNADVCYSFWSFAASKMVEDAVGINYIDQEKLKEFIMKCEDEDGGFSDHVGDEPDLFHLMFALAGLSLLGEGGIAKTNMFFGL